jgi:phosphoribosylformylglycinamidine synthase
MPKAEVADPQGNAVCQALNTLGYTGVGEVRAGKFMEVILEAKEQEEARTQVAEMCRKILSNPVIEEFSFEIRALERRG